MTTHISTGAVHHLRLTVSNFERSRQFYIGVLGFQVAMELGANGVLLTNGSVLLGLGNPPFLDRAIVNDRFDENRIGLDHLSLSVPNRQALDQAARDLEAHGIPHGEVKDLGPAFGIYVLIFRDPDNIQLELTAPYP